MLKNIKGEFGKFLRMVRESRGMSRAMLAIRLGISPRTIQSWESGRTFIESLDLVPQLDAVLGCSISHLIAMATGATKSTDKHLVGLEAQQNLLTQPGPLSPKINITQLSKTAPIKSKTIETEYIAVPMLKAMAMLNPSTAIRPKDIVNHVFVSREWMPRSGILVAVRMRDSAMAPVIPHGAIVVINRQPMPVEKVLDRIIALDLAGKGLRIRRVIRDMAKEKRYFGIGATEHGRARMPIRESRGDRVIGKVIGIQSVIG